VRTALFGVISQRIVAVSCRQFRTICQSHLAGSTIQKIIVFKGGYNIILLCRSAECEFTVMRNKQIIIWTVSELHDFTS
jgi:hypothetical protein